MNGVIQRKLALLDTRVARLESRIKEVNLAVFTADWVLRSMAERELQVAVEMVIDVAERIIAIKGHGPVATSADAIRRLVDIGVIGSESPYVDMVRFRNMIVHQYEEIDPNILYTLATKRLTDFRTFRDEIDQAIASEADE